MRARLLDSCIKQGGVRGDIPHLPADPLGVIRILRKVPKHSYLLLPLQILLLLLLLLLLVLLRPAMLEVGINSANGPASAWLQQV